MEQKHHIKLPLFGSPLTHNYSIRPELDLTSVHGRQFALAFLREYHALILSLGGSIAGGTPEGRLKAIFTNTHTPPELKALYHELKTIFDPNHTLNPDIKQDANLRAVVSALRTSYSPGIIKE